MKLKTKKRYIHTYIQPRCVQLLPTLVWVSSVDLASVPKDEMGMISAAPQTAAKLVSSFSGMQRLLLLSLHPGCAVVGP